MEKAQTSFKYIKTIGYYDGDITCLDIFPSGEFISISRKGIVFIWKDLNVIKTYEIQGNGNYVVGIKDNENLIIVSENKEGFLWKKEKVNGDFKVMNEINLNMHKSKIRNAFYHEGIYIICSDDLITFWEEYKKNGQLNYQIQLRIEEEKDFYSTLLIKNKNLFITGGKLGLKLWNMNNLSLINKTKEEKEMLKSIHCKSSALLKVFDENSIIVGVPNQKLCIIDLLTLKKKDINITFDCSAICVLNDLFFVSSDIQLHIYDKKSFNNISSIQNASMTKEINDIKEIKKNTLALYAYSGYIRLFSNQI